MRDPYRKKQRDLRRAARSAQRPRIYNLFDVYHPEYKEFDRSYRSIDWHIYYDAQYDWVNRIAGDCCPSWGGGGVPACFRRDENRKLRTRQKAALLKAAAEGNWDDFLLPLNRRNIRWLYW